MVVQARAEATRRRIIDAAIALFSEEGYGDTGLAAIMDRADVSKGAFYYHFESKEALASAIIGEGVTQLMDTFNELTSAPSPARPARLSLMDPLVVSATTALPSPLPSMLPLVVSALIADRTPVR